MNERAAYNARDTALYFTLYCPVVLIVQGGRIQDMRSTLTVKQIVHHDRTQLKTEQYVAGTAVVAFVASNTETNICPARGHQIE